MTMVLAHNNTGIFVNTCAWKEYFNMCNPNNKNWQSVQYKIKEEHT